MFKTPREQISTIVLSTLLAAFSLVAIILFTDPFTSGSVTHLFFYGSLYLTSLGLFTLLGLAARRMFTEGLYGIHLGDSFRQAIFISALIVASFALQASELLSWWVELTLILFLTSLEIFLNLKT